MTGRPRISSKGKRPVIGGLLGEACIFPTEHLVGRWDRAYDPWGYDPMGQALFVDSRRISGLTPCTAPPEARSFASASGVGSRMALSEQKAEPAGSGRCLLILARGSRSASIGELVQGGQAAAR